MQETSDNLRAETRGQYAARRRAWLAVNDHESIRAVLNVLPEEFRQRVESRMSPLWKRTTASMFGSPSYAVTPSQSCKRLSVLT